MADLPKRKRLRLDEYDYSSEGAYFITICVKNRQRLLSSVVGHDAYIVPKIELTRIGRVVKQYVERINEIDSFVIMPNHVHLILFKSKYNNTDVSKDIRSLKTPITKQIGYSVWQSGYYDHIIRNERDYLIKRQYIEENPIRWFEDEYYNEK